MTTYLDKERAYMPWESALDNLDFFYLMFDRTEIYGLLQVCSVLPYKCRRILTNILTSIYFDLWVGLAMHYRCDQKSVRAEIFVESPWARSGCIRHGSQSDVNLWPLVLTSISPWTQQAVQSSVFGKFSHQPFFLFLYICAARAFDKHDGIFTIGWYTKCSCFILLIDIHLE